MAASGISSGASQGAGAQVTDEIKNCPVCERICLVIYGSYKTGSLHLGSATGTLRPHPRCGRHQKLIASALGLDVISDTLPPATHEIGQLFIHKCPINMATVITPEIPHGPGHPKPLVSVLYLAGNTTHAKVNTAELGSGRLLDPQWIDRDQLVSWKSACTSLHSGLCQGLPDAALSTIRPTWLVDVQRQCLVKAPPNSSYVALSYVWGCQPTLKTTRKNVGLLQERGSLTQQRLATTMTMPIARTIRDAMGVVGLLSERYLWADMLCIVQDDESEKHSEILKMSMIYANASVTILAVQGEHADSGLRGLRGISEPRQLRQSIHALDDETMVISTPAESGLFEPGVGEPVWATRGWTFQEQYFSRRKVIFDGDSIRWECSSAIWREHVQLPSHLDKTQESIVGCDSMLIPRLPNLGSVGLILADYNKRNFTFPEDCPRAFESISLVLSPQMAGRFVSGLPSAFFDIALLWQPTGKIRRRVAKEPSEAHCLPSWSWFGWSGHVDLPDRSAWDFVRSNPDKWQSIPVVTRTLRWESHETPGSAGEPIHASIFESKEKWMAGDIGSVPGWSKHVVEAVDRESGDPDPDPDPDLSRLRSHFYTHEAYPQYQFWYPIPLMGREMATPSLSARYISCQSRRAWLFPDKDRWRTSRGSYPLHTLRDRYGAWTGVLEPHSGLNASGSALQNCLGEAVELVELAAGYCRDVKDLSSGSVELKHEERPRLGSWYEYYWVMWVEWVEGVAYRKGLGRVYKRCWEEQRGESFRLLLG